MKNIVIFFVLCLFVACQWKSKGQETLPAFDLLLKDSVTHFNTSAINSGSPIVLMYFSPDCEHCQKETEGIIQNMDSLKHVRFYLVTNDPIERMQVYDKMYKLDKYPNIILGRDYKYFFPVHFKNAAPPYLVVYDRHKVIKAVFTGETSAGQLIAFIKTLS